ncbi:hypothetical protein ES705_40556 [subsurface metagenome]
MTKDDVNSFLNEFKEKLEFWGVLYRDDRGKNIQSLLDLEIVPGFRKQVLKNLKVNDYSEGPIKDTLHKGSDMWVFGTVIKNKEIYIKISLGYKGAEVSCISFHLAEQPLNYPYRKTPI